MQHPKGMQRAEGALLLTALSCPVVLWGTSLPWQWVLLGGGAAFVLFLAVSQLLPAGSVLPALTRAVFGPVFGGILLALQAAWLLAPAFLLLQAGGNVFPGQADSPLYPVVLAVLALAAVWRDGERPAAVGGILFYFVALVLVVILALPVPQLELRWLYTAAPIERALPAAAILLLPMTALYAGARGGRRLWPWVLTGCLFAAAAALVTWGYLSPQVARQEPAAFMTMTRSLHLFGVMERFEALLSAVLTVGCVCCQMQFLRCARAAVPSAPRTAVVSFTLASLGLCFLAPRIPPLWMLVGTAVFWILLPLCTVLRAAAKNCEKKEKNT